MRLCPSICVCVGALVVQLIESWVYDPEDTGSNPRAGEKKRTTKNITSTPAHPSVNGYLVLYWGSKAHQLCLIVPLMVVVGLQGAHTGSGRHGRYFLRVLCLGSRSAHSTGTSYLLSARLVQERVTCNRQQEALLFTLAQYAPGLCVCVRLCVCVSSKNTPVCVLQLENLHENTLCSFFTEFIVL